ncbi:MAG TPA: hypothetical protein VJK06_07770 [Methyloceanibacter sp.]|jgi:hypothetical protein|nr:hypothetical protein [Methyloceanibacter sp.]
MLKWLAILLLPLALAGCVTEQRSALPMTLAPTDDAQCLRYGDAPTFGDCAKQGSVTVSQEAK